MAGDVSYRGRGVDGSFAKEVQAELGILVVYLQQRVVDYLGRRRWSVRAYCLAALSGGLEYQRSC